MPKVSDSMEDDRQKRIKMIIEKTDYSGCKLMERKEVGKHK